MSWQIGLGKVLLICMKVYNQYVYVRKSNFSVLIQL